MTRNEMLTLITALTMTVLAGSASAQGAKMLVNPQSKVTLAGGSNVHDWACKSSEFQATIELDSAYDVRPLNAVGQPITRVAVTIPAKSLKCGHNKMDENMYKALKATEFPDIRYLLDTYEVNKDLSTPDSFAAQTQGSLTVAGVTTRVEIPVTAQRATRGAMKGTGSVTLRMTDFGIKPPVALLGTLRTKNEIEVRFEVLLDRAVVVALTQQ